MNQPLKPKPKPRPRKKKGANGTPTGDELFDRWEQLSAEHLASYQRVRHICDHTLQELLDRLDHPTPFDPDNEEDPNRVDPYKLRSLVQSLTAAIEGERRALSMEFMADRRAVAKVQQLGFIIQLPDGSVAIDTEYDSGASANTNV